MEIFVYRKNKDSVEEGFPPADLPALIADKENVVWVDFFVTDDEQIKEAEDILLNVFKFHHLTVEDCVETRNQPKVEAFPHYFFFIVHGIKTGQTNPSNFTTKELDGYLGDNFVVTFYRESFASIERVKRQIRSTSFACERGAAYLLHQIFDQLVDLYMPIVDDFDKSINDLEDRVFQMKRGNTAILEEIMDLRRSVARLKRITARQLDVLYRISHGEFPQIPDKTLPFYRDVHDHLLRISDLAEGYRDLVGGLFDIHFSVTANKTNDVMKVLAVFSAIMLPLSVIAGIYGMNTPLPDSDNPNSFWHVVIVMIIFASVLLFYFWRKGWILEGKDNPK